MSKKPSAKAQNAADRAAIRAAGPVAFLIDAMQGKPAPRRDAVGRIIAWEDPLDYDKRVAVAQGLAKKILPDLSAQQIDLTSGGEGGIKIILSDGVLPPASVDDATVIEHQEEQIEDRAGVGASQIAHQEGVTFPPDEDPVYDPITNREHENDQPLADEPHVRTKRRRKADA